MICLNLSSSLSSAYVNLGFARSSSIAFLFSSSLLVTSLTSWLAFENSSSAPFNISFCSSNVVVSASYAFVTPKMAVPANINHPNGLVVNHVIIAAILALIEAVRVPIEIEVVAADVAKPVFETMACAFAPVIPAVANASSNLAFVHVAEPIATLVSEAIKPALINTSSCLAVDKPVSAIACATIEALIASLEAIKPACDKTCIFCASVNWLVDNAILACSKLKPCKLFTYAATVSGFIALVAPSKTSGIALISFAIAWTPLRLSIDAFSALKFLINSTSPTVATTVPRPPNLVVTKSNPFATPVNMSKNPFIILVLAKFLSIDFVAFPSLFSLPDHESADISRFIQLWSQLITRRYFIFVHSIWLGCCSYFFNYSILN